MVAFGCFSHYDKLVTLTTKLVSQKKRDKSDKLKYFEVYQELKYQKTHFSLRIQKKVTFFGFIFYIFYVVPGS